MTDPTPTTPTAHLEKWRSHAKAAYRKVPRSRDYALDDGALDALASLTCVWQRERAQEDINFDLDDLTEFFGEVAVHIPALVQPSPGEAPPTANTAWVDEITGQPAPNPWASDPPDLRSQAAVERHDPALAEHLKRIAKAGVTYALLAEMREAAARQERLAAIRYDESDHRNNAFRVPHALTAQSELKTADPLTAEVFQREAQPLTLPWQVGHGNMTAMAQLSNANPAFGKLARQAAELLQQWTRNELAVARAAEEQAREQRIAAEMRLKVPGPKQ